MSAVLIVDDTPDCSDPLARLLRKRGHTVVCAPGGMEAWPCSPAFGRT